MSDKNWTCSDTVCVYNKIIWYYNAESAIHGPCKSTVHAQVPDLRGSLLWLQYLSIKWDHARNACHSLIHINLSDTNACEYMYLLRYTPYTNSTKKSEYSFNLNWVKCKHITCACMYTTSKNVVEWLKYWYKFYINLAVTHVIIHFLYSKTCEIRTPMGQAKKLSEEDYMRLHIHDKL
jgi:hypothetical protein